MGNRCIACGEIIPEGRQICPECESKVEFESCDRYKWNMKMPDEKPCCECVHNAKEHFEPKTNADRLGNTVKYIARAGRKDDIVQDLKKAKEYLQFEIDYLEEERERESGLQTGSSNGKEKFLYLLNEENYSSEVAE
jgi:hypothetical protein